MSIAGDYYFVVKINRTLKQTLRFIQKIFLGLVKMDFSCFKGKKVLITGHTGFKGSWLAQWLEMLGATTYGIALKPDTQPNHYELLDLQIQSIILDIRHFKEFKTNLNKIDPEVIFHLATQPLVRESYKQPLLTLETNVLGTANLLEAARSLKNLKAVVVVTTDKCYENKEIDYAYRETDPLGGYDPYSASKACAELVVSSFRNSFFNLDEYGKSHQVLIASARAGNVIGGGDWAPDRLVPDIIRAIVDKKELFIRYPHAIRPWQHVLESLQGYLCLVEKLLKGEKSFAGAWNFGPADQHVASVLNVVKTIQTIWPEFKYKVQNNLEPHEAHFLKLNSQKAHLQLNWKSRWGFQEAIGKTVEWYKEFYEHKHFLTSRQITEYMDS